MTLTKPVQALFCALLVAACSSSSGAGGPAPTPTGTAPPVITPPVDDAAQRAKAVQAMHDVLLADVNALAEAAVELQAAAPTTTGRGWDRTMDAAAIAAMRAIWLKARTA